MALPTTQQQEDIASIYAAIWNRAPDPVGFGYWVDLYANGMPLDDIADAFRDSAEGRAAYPLYQTAEEFITQVYLNVFNREPDAAGLAYWENLLSTGAYTEGDFITVMVDSAVAQAAEGNEDGLLFLNKVDVGMWVAMDYLSGNATQDQIDVVTGNAFRYLTSSASSVQTAENYISHLPVGTPYELTVNQDTWNGVAGNDLFIANLAAVSGTNYNTLTIGDRLNGGEGTDTLDVTLVSDMISPFTLQNVERVELEAVANVSLANAFAGVQVVQLEDTVGFNATVSGTLADLEEVSIYNSNSDASIVVSATATAAELTLRLDTAEDVTVTMNAVATDTLNIISQGGASSGIAVLGDVLDATTLNITANADLGISTLTLADMTDLTIVGSVDVDLSGAGVSLSAAADSLVTVDASEALGDITLTLAGSASLVADFGIGDDVFDITANTTSTPTVNVNMGAGDDVLEVNYTLPGNTVVVLDGGEGTNDVLSIYGADTSTELNETDFNFGTVQGFETLHFATSPITLADGAASLTLVTGFDTVDFSDTTIAFGTDGALSLVNSAADLTVDFGVIGAASSGFSTRVDFDLTVDANADLTINFTNDATIIAGSSEALDWNFANADTLTFNVSAIGDNDVQIEFDATGNGTAASFYADEITTLDISGGSVASSFTLDLSGASDTNTSDLTLLETVDISGFAGTVTLNLDAGLVIENSLEILLNDGIVGAATVATITGADTADIYVFADDLDGTVYITNFQNNGAFANGDKLDVNSLGITNLNQLDVDYYSAAGVLDAGFSYALITAADASGFDGTIRVNLNNATQLTAGDFIFI